MTKLLLIIGCHVLQFVFISAKRVFPLKPWWGGQLSSLCYYGYEKKLLLILVFDCLQRFFRSDIFSKVWSKELTSVPKNYPNEVHPLPNLAVFSFAWPWEFEVNSTQNRKVAHSSEHMWNCHNPSEVIIEQLREI